MTAKPLAGSSDLSTEVDQLPISRTLSSAGRRSTIVQLLPLLGLFLFVSAVTYPGRAPTGDEGPIIDAAHRLLQGRYAVLGTMDATQFLWHGPGLPAFLAPLVALRIPLNALRLTSPLLMFVAVLLFYRLLRLRLTPRTARFGAYALGLYAPAYYVIGTVAKEPLSLVLIVGALDGTARYLKSRRLRHALIGGLSLGALAMTRLEYGWVIAAALGTGLLWWLVARVRHRVASEMARVARRWTLICAVGMLACVPWLAYTYSITRRLFYWGNSGGISLYWMSSPSPTQLGQWHAPHTVLTDPALAAYRPFFQYLNTLRPLQRDLELQHMALVQALGHPAKYALNLLANLGRTFLGFPFSFDLPTVVIVVLILVNGALLAGVLAAGTSLIRARSSLPRETVPFLLFGVLAFAVHLFPTGEPRMVVPIIPIPIWLIGQAWGRRTRSGVVDGVLAAAEPPT